MSLAEPARAGDLLAEAHVSFLTYLWHYLLARLIYDHLVVVVVAIIVAAIVTRRRWR